MECVQYADDTSLYSYLNVKELDSRAVDMNETLASITNWSQDSNLALNSVKTKCLLRCRLTTLWLNVLYTYL